MSVLVTGGAGYIGAHVVRLLKQQGRDVVVIDNESTGSGSRVTGVPLYSESLTSHGARESIAHIMERHQVDAVIHLAAKKQVGESVQSPTLYYRENVLGLANVIDAMADTGVGKLVFSSSAAVYGTPPIAKVDEAVRPEPINPYGETKLVGEWLVADASVASGLRYANLRYFNVAGAGWDDLGDPAALNLITIVFQRMENGENPVIFGDTYATLDGTCIRDYVHVLDLARAHAEALDYLDSENREHHTFNVGTGVGSSVREVIASIERASGIELTPIVEAPRPGDPAHLIADASRITDTLGWHPQFGLDEIIESAWSAHVHRRG